MKLRLLYLGSSRRASSTPTAGYLAEIQQDRAIREGAGQRRAFGDELIV
jgi:hypothetical protein